MAQHLVAIDLGRERARALVVEASLRKAQILADRLRRAFPTGTRPPWVEPLVFLAHEGVKLGLTPDGLTGVVNRASFAAACAFPRVSGSSNWKTWRGIQRLTLA